MQSRGRGKDAKPGTGKKCKAGDEEKMQSRGRGQDAKQGKRKICKAEDEQTQVGCKAGDEQEEENEQERNKG